MTWAPLASGASEAHCGQLGSAGWFLAGEQNSCGWQASIMTVEGEDIKRRLVLEKPETQGCACGGTAGHLVLREKPRPQRA